MLTLIIAAFNEEKELPVALGSLARQIDSEFNIIFVNNASTDRTREILDDFVFPSQTKKIVIDEPKIGRINALKAGISTALELESTDLLAFSDADAFFGPSWSYETKKLFLNKDVSFAYSTERFKSEGLHLLPNFSQCLADYTWMLYQMRSKIGGYINMGHYIVKKDVFVKIGGLDEEWKRSEDTLLTMKLLSKGYIGTYSAGQIWFSARRLLDRDNIVKWCKDQDYLEFVSINGGTTLKPIRVTENMNFVGEDISPSLGEEALSIRSQRLFRRLLVLTIFEMESQSYIMTKAFRYFPELVQKWSEDLPLIKKGVFEVSSSVLERYKFADGYVRSHYQDLIRLGGEEVKNVFGKPGKEFNHIALPLIIEEEWKE